MGKCYRLMTRSQSSGDPVPLDCEFISAACYTHTHTHKPLKWGRMAWGGWSLLPTGKLSSVQWLSRVQLFATPWIAACQASLSIKISQSSLKLMSIESVMPSSHLILCHPLLLLPSILQASRSFPLSQLFSWGGQSTGVSALASFLPKNPRADLL